MTKQELCDIVDRIYASWNQQIPATQQKAIYNAWWRILQHCNPDDIHTTIDHMVITETYMPKPGQIWTHNLQQTNTYNPPTPQQAWQQLRQAAHAAHTGTHNPNNTIHPDTQHIIQQLGTTTAYNLHTNNDREHFTTLYQQHIKQRQLEHFHQQNTENL